MNFKQYFQNIFNIQAFEFLKCLKNFMQENHSLIPDVYMNTETKIIE